MPDRSAPRTLADQLRSWPDADVVRLLSARPDLASPAPQDSAQLASRAGARASVLRAVDRLDTLHLAVLDATVVLGGSPSAARLREHVHADGGSVDEAVSHLRQLALMWGTPDRLRVLSTVGEVVGSSLSRLGPPVETLLSSYGPNRLTTLTRELGLVPSGLRQDDISRIAQLLSRPQSIEALVRELDHDARSLLSRLEVGGGLRTVESSEHQGTRRETGSPAEQLMARGLVVARDRRHVVVPGEVGLALRGGRTTRTPVDAAPTLASSLRAHVDRSAAGAAFDFLRGVELLLEHWESTPPSVLRGGGLGVRDLRASAQVLQVSERAAALHVEVASAAGLLGPGEDRSHAGAWLPTDAFDAWTARPVADRWATLALAWLDNPRLTGLIGGRDANKKPVNALAPGLERVWIAETRRMCLEQVAGLGDGEVLSPDGGTESLVGRMAWLRPRQPALRARAVGWVVDEAGLVGVTGLGGLSAHGRALLGGAAATHASATLAPLLPQPVDHVLLQADLTAVAPGPLERDLAHRLLTMADVESRGGATVYRFTAASVRRAFDAGWSAAEIHEFVAAASRTPVPQPLTYLVNDVSRRFGTVRVGAVESFLRSDDEAALHELVHKPEVTSLRLRRIAPTVVVSDVPVDVLLPRLRELGAAPVVEGPDGTVRMPGGQAMRARVPGHRRHPAHLEASTLAARATATVAAIRAGDRAAASRLSHPTAAGVGGPANPTAVLAALREAAEAGGAIVIGYVDNHGATTERVVEPVQVRAGQLTAFDQRSQQVRLFAIHRITGVYPLAPTRP